MYCPRIAAVVRPAWGQTGALTFECFCGDLWDLDHSQDTFLFRCILSLRNFSDPRRIVKNYWIFKNKHFIEANFASIHAEAVRNSNLECSSEA